LAGNLIYRLQTSSQNIGWIGLKGQNIAQ